MADFADRSLGIGYTGGSTPVRLPRRRARPLVLVARYNLCEHGDTPKVEAFYWAAITFSQTLGTAVGDWVAKLRARL